VNFDHITITVGTASADHDVTASITGALRYMHVYHSKLGSGPAITADSSLDLEQEIQIKIIANSQAAHDET
jgi:hypothetical protein